MLYRFKECYSRKGINHGAEDLMLYKGVPWSKTQIDLQMNRLHFSRAIDFNRGMVETEMFRTNDERDHEYDVLGLGGDELDHYQVRDQLFFDRSDQLCKSLSYINCWSYSKEIALEFAPRGDRAILVIPDRELIDCLLQCFSRWNNLQLGEHQMTNEDGSLRHDWHPESVRYAFGQMAYPDRSACRSSTPFRLGRAMRLPGGSSDLNQEEEREWRIALDLSEMPSSIKIDAMLEAELMPSRLALMAKSLEMSDCEPMISLNGRNGLWLNDFRLRDASNFSYHALDA